MFALCSAAFSVSAGYRQAAFLHHVWVAEQSVYVMSDHSESVGVDVRRYIETETGIRQAGSVFNLHDHVLGSGPGLKDSLLLLCQTSDRNGKLLRLSNGKIQKVCELHNFSFGIDPEFTLSETSQGVEIQDPDTEGDAGELRIWKYDNRWTGPTLKHTIDRSIQINSTESVTLWEDRTDRTGNSKIRASIHHSSTLPRTTSVSINKKKLGLSVDPFDWTLPIQNLSNNSMVFLLKGKHKDCLLKIGRTATDTTNRPEQLWRHAGTSTLHSGGIFEPPIFADTRGRIWFYYPSHEFKQLRLTLVRK
jgi:hypothetical protein